MLVKHIFGLLLLLLCNVAVAQELNSVFYGRIHRQVIIKKSGNKEKTPWQEATEAGEAQLIYSPGHLLFISHQGTDTVFVSKINKTYQGFIGNRREFYITYNNKSDYITLLFCHRKNAKKFKGFLRENGGQYRRNIVVKILVVPLLLVFGVSPFDSFSPLLWRKWSRTCQ